MFSRRRRDRTPTPPELPSPAINNDEPSMSGVMSLLGGVGVSLDGESLILPSVNIPSELDDISAIEMGTVDGSANIENFKIVGEVTADESGTASRDVPDSVGRDEENEQASGEDDGRACLPQWLTGAPQWMKLAIVLSSALLVGALVLIGVASVIDEQQRGAIDVTSATGGDNPIAPPVSASDFTVLSSSPSEQPLSPPSSPLAPSVETQAPIQESTPEPTNTPSNIIPTTIAPTTAIPTEMPSSTPSTHLPTYQPSVAPTPEQTPQPNTIEGTSTVFYVTAGRANGDTLDDYEALLPELPQSPGAFMVHLGDWNSPLYTNCDENSFQFVTNLFSRTSVPVYFVPGDNEYNDCPEPEIAYDYWGNYLVDFERQHWPSPPWEVQRDTVLKENFGFVLRRVLFVGLHLVGGRVHDEEEWEARHERNLEWLDTQVSANSGMMDMLVVFCHVDPAIQTNRNFYDAFFDRIRNEYNTRTLLVHRNIGAEDAGFEPDFEDIEKLDVLVTEGGLWPPMKVEIDTESTFISWNQDDWFDEQKNNN